MRRESFKKMMWRKSIIPLLLLLILPNVASDPKPECSPIKMADILAAAECSKMVYDYYDQTAEGQMVSANSKFKVVKDFDYDVEKEENNGGQRRDFLEKGHYLKAAIAQAKEDDDSTTTMFCFMGTKSNEQLAMQKDPFTSFSGVTDLTPKTCINPSKGTLLKTEKECNETQKSVNLFEYDWKTYMRFKRFITDEFVPMIESGEKYIITGHSLGGALSSILAMMTLAVKDGALWKNRDSSLITFGQPRVGDSKFAGLIDTIPNDQKLRFIYHRDIVPQVPPRDFPWLKENPARYTHHSREIYITNEMQPSKDVWIVCPPGDTHDCGNVWKLMEASDKDHDMAHYLEAVKTMASSPDKVKQFMEDICMDEDSPNLKALKEKREEIAQSNDDDANNDPFDDWMDEEWDEMGDEKKTKKAKRKGKVTKKFKKGKH